VLETLILYNYPSCTGSGLTPKPEERFRSEFFTKKVLQIQNVIKEILTQIISRGWLCAWSYSDSGNVNISDVISEVSQHVMCDVVSFCAPFTHKSQGGVKPAKVNEYLVIFKPKKSN
jgi:hypothetical protein